ncbi:MAG: hypothetical protein GY950_15355 [bacterium]|nr:hypothetical protein [bacterium]
MGVFWERLKSLEKTLKGISKRKTHNPFDIRGTVGREGTVRLKIPPEGEGKVQVPLQGKPRELAAISKYKTELNIGERVVVDAVLGTKLLVVKKASF